MLTARGSTLVDKKGSRRDEPTEKPTLPPRKIPRCPGLGTIERYCRELIPGYDPWRDSAGYSFHVKRARAAVRWFHAHLTHVKGELGGKAFKLEPWQVAIIGNLFGWYAKDDTRRFRTAFIFVPRKNGKTPMAAGLANFMFVEDKEPGAEVYSAASTREQARLVWIWAKGQILNDEYLSKTCKVFQHAIILNADPMATYKAVAAEAGGLHGFNSHVVVVDELHTFSKNNEEVIDVLETSTAARRQPLIAHITTAGWDRNSICYKKYDYACRVRDGEDGYCDPKFLPVIYEAKQDDDWSDPDVWEKANPNLGVSVKRDYFEAEFERASKDAAYENRFRQLHLNQWTEQAVRWIPMEQWDKCVGVPFEDEDLAGRVCYGGLDLAISRDLTALSLMFPDEDGGFTVRVWHWIPAENAREREQRDKVPYREWAKAGCVEMTPGNVTDHEYLIRSILEMKERFDLRSIGFDPWQARSMAARLKEQHGVEMVEVPQGIVQMSEPSMQLYKLIMGGKLRHGGDPCLRWQAGNVEVRVDVNGNLKPLKSNDANRIDGFIATIMALKLAMLDNKAGCVYDERGLIELEW